MGVSAAAETRPSMDPESRFITAQVCRLTGATPGVQTHLLRDGAVHAEKRDRALRRGREYIFSPSGVVAVHAAIYLKQRRTSPSIIRSVGQFLSRLPFEELRRAADENLVLVAAGSAPPQLRRADACLISGLAAVEDVAVVSIRPLWEKVVARLPLLDDDFVARR